MNVNKRQNITKASSQFHVLMETFLEGEMYMARNDGHCASVPVGQQPFHLSTRIPYYPFTSCQGIRNFKYSRGCCL